MTFSISWHFYIYIYIYILYIYSYIYIYNIWCSFPHRDNTSHNSHNSHNSHQGSPTATRPWDPGSVDRLHPGLLAEFHALRDHRPLRPSADVGRSATNEVSRRSEVAKCCSGGESGSLERRYSCLEEKKRTRKKLPGRWWSITVLFFLIGLTRIRAWNSVIKVEAVD